MLGWYAGMRQSNEVQRHFWLRVMKLAKNWMNDPEK